MFANVAFYLMFHPLMGGELSELVEFSVTTFAYKRMTEGSLFSQLVHRVCCVEFLLLAVIFITVIIFIDELLPPMWVQYDRVPVALQVRVRVRHASDRRSGATIALKSYQVLGHCLHPWYCFPFWGHVLE